VSLRRSHLPSACFATTYVALGPTCLAMTTVVPYRTELPSVCVATTVLWRRQELPFTCVYMTLASSNIVTLSMFCYGVGTCPHCVLPRRSQLPLAQRFSPRPLRNDGLVGPDRVTLSISSHVVGSHPQ